MSPDRVPRGGLTPRHAAVALLAALVIVAMLLTSGQMSDLRVALPPLSRAMSWLEGLPLPFDMDHVAFFALVGAALRIVLPQARWWWLLLALAALAVCTELLQFATVGRTPKLLDARDDMIGAGIGLLLGALALWCGRWARGLLWHGLPSNDNLASIVGMTRKPAPLGGDDLHAVLAGWLVGQDGRSPAEVVARHGADAVLAACEREGVVSLVHARLTEMLATEPVPQELLQGLATRARLCAARSLLCVSEARKIQQTLDAAGIPAIWLKGIALGQWLYPRAHLRDTADIDLLLPDHATTLRAAEVLAPLGYTLPNPHIAGDLVVHELLAWSERAQLELDLHWDLSNDALFGNRIAWNALWGDAAALPGLGVDARGLSPAHALLHACIHRALNHLTGRENRLRWLYEIHLLWVVLASTERDDAVTRALRHSLANPCLTALQAAMNVFDTEVAPQLLRRLNDAARRERVNSARLGGWLYFQWATLRCLPSSERVRWLRQRLFPAMAHLHVRYGAGAPATSRRVVVRRLVDGVRRVRRWMAH